jgi:DNA polymerase-3 subunit alpha
LAFEKEFLGFYLSGHPVERYKVEIKAFTNATTKKLTSMGEGQSVSMIGLISHIKTTTTKRTGERMAILQIEDLDGSVETLVFPRTYQQISQYIKDAAIVVVKGKLTLKEDAPKIIADDLRDINEIYRLIRMITVDMTKSEPEKLIQLRKKLERFPGNVPVHLQIDTRNFKSVEIKVGKDLHVSPSEVLMDEIKTIVGEEAFKVVI